MISYCLRQTKKETEKVTKPWVMICCYSEPVACCNAESFAPGVTGTVVHPPGEGTEVDPPAVTGTVVHPLGGEANQMHLRLKHGLVEKQGRV